MYTLSYSYYIGPTPHVLVTDLDMLKQIMVKDFNNFMDHEVGAAIQPLAIASKSMHYIMHP